MERSCKHCGAGLSGRSKRTVFCGLSCAAKHRGTLLYKQRISQEEKRCGRCGIVKSTSRFTVKNKDKNLYSAECKDCHKAYRKAYYETNRAAEIARVRTNSASRMEAFKRWKATLSCVRCGFNSHPAALHFHHRDPSEKEVSLAQAVSRGLSLKRIEEEIAKCDVLCANCHAMEHAANYWPP